MIIIICTAQGDDGDLVTSHHVIAAVPAATAATLAKRYLEVHSLRGVPSGIHWERSALKLEGVGRLAPRRFGLWTRML